MPNRKNDIVCRIYVASLADYNAGSLHATWINLDFHTSADDIQETINALLAASPEAKRTGLLAEEWAIHEYEGIPSMGENPSLDDIWAAYEAIEEHGEAWIEYADHIGTRYATVEGFEEAYQGEYDSEKDFAYQLVDDLGYLDQMPESLQYYFDYEAFTRDLFSYDYFMTESGYVFRNI